MIKIIDEPSILQATAIKVSEGLQPNRLVLRKVDGPHPYSIHRENLSFQMNVFGEPQVLTWVHREFYWGNYFKTLGEAKQAFYERTSGAYSV